MSSGIAQGHTTRGTPIKHLWDKCGHLGCRHGFVGILVLAAWPNAAFDLCGICCGHFLMPFWDFFGATFIGKAILKVRALCLMGCCRRQTVS